MPTSEQIRVGKQANLVETVFNMTGASQTLFTANAFRIGILVCPHATITFSLDPTNPAILNQGMTFPPLGQPYFLSIENVGNAIFGQWFAIGSAIGNVSFWEVRSVAG